MPFDNLALFLPGQRVENLPQLTARLPEDCFAPPLGQEDDVILAVPFRMGWALLKLRHKSSPCWILIKPPGEDLILERSNLFESHWSNQWLTQNQLMDTRRQQQGG